VVERFWEQVDVRGPDECWPWLGPKDGKQNGYGHMRVAGKTLKAHRIAWELTRGPIPQFVECRGACICHSCDSRSCCNPKHLFLSNQKGNLADMDAKGRRVNKMQDGEANSNARLTNEIVMQILSATDLTCKQAGIAFGTSPENVCMIRNGKRWAHIHKTQEAHRGN
jgi:hypothetical protein